MVRLLLELISILTDAPSYAHIQDDSVRACMALIGMFTQLKG